MRMNVRPRKNAVNRRDFLAQTSTGLIAAAVPGSTAWSAVTETPMSAEPTKSVSRLTGSSGAKKKIPIGVFDPVYEDLGLDEMLDKVSVGFSGCPGGTPTDTQPNWITYNWPPEYHQMLQWQWKEKVIPYWKDAAKYARSHGIKRLAFEMHPNFVVYNPRTLMKLREAVGEEIGANCDLSHLFWQGCDPVEVIHFLGKQGALFHAHMKDTVIFPENCAEYGVLNFASEKDELPEASDTFRAVGYGHGAGLWKSIVKAYMDIGFEGILSIENEDPILAGEVGVERAAYVLKNVRKELLGE